MATIPVCENGLAVALAMNRLSGNMPRRVRASPRRKTMSPSRSTFWPQSPSGHRRVHGHRRKLPGRPGLGRGRPPEIARPARRFHPVGRFHRALFVVKKCDRPAKETQHGKSPDASRGVGAKASGTNPRSFLVLGKLPCTERGLSSATELRQASRGPAVVRGNDRDSTGDDWTVSEQSAAENPLGLKRHHL